MDTNKIRTIIRLIMALLLLSFFQAGSEVGAQNDDEKPTATEIPIVKGPTAKADDIELGFDVPVPMDSKTPVAGFRKYERVVERIQDLAGTLDTANIVTRSNIGKSRNNRDVWMLKISDADATRDDGTPEPAVFINGCIHAREWISPEVVLRLVENFVANYATNKDDRTEFLVNNCDIYIVVVSNPDGLVYTQNAFNKVANFKEADTSFSSRDGRLRRKNLRGHPNQNFAMVTDRVAIAGLPQGAGNMAFEGLLGVDLNRNFKKGYAANNQSSSDPRSIVHRGVAGTSEANYNLANAEPEIRNIINLVTNTITENRLRGFIDYHSFRETIVLPLVGIAHRDDLAKKLRLQLRDAIVRANGPVYTTSDTDGFDTPKKGEEIGAADERMANTARKPPSFTFELSPRRRTANGFILPNNRVAGVTNENLPAARLLIDFAIGPAYLKKVIIWVDDENDGKIDTAKEIRYQGEWSGKGPRKLTVGTREWVKAGTIKFLLVFSEPMKIPKADGSPVELDATTAAKDPTVKFKQKEKENAKEHTVTKAGGWLKEKTQTAEGKITPGFAEYQFDTWEGTFTIPQGQSADFDAAKVQLTVEAKDLLENELDGNPETVLDFNEQWILFEDGEDETSKNSGGVDNAHIFKIDTKRPRRR